MSPDCLLAVVPQPTDSRLSETAQISVSSYHILKGLRHGEQICDCEMYNFVLLQLHQVKLAISSQWQLPAERLRN